MAKTVLFSIFSPSFFYFNTFLYFLLFPRFLAIFWEEDPWGGKSSSSHPSSIYSLSSCLCPSSNPRDWSIILYIECKLHVALHGCKQYAASVGTVFIEHKSPLLLPLSPFFSRSLLSSSPSDFRVVFLYIWWKSNFLYHLLQSSADSMRGPIRTISSLSLLRLAPSSWLPSTPTPVGTGTLIFPVLYPLIC